MSLLSVNCHDILYFRGQAKELLEQLVASLNLHVNDVGCLYEGDIRAVFVETYGQCQPIKIIASIQSEINSSFYCASASEIDGWPSHWNSTYGDVEILKTANDHLMNLSHCSTLTKGVNIQKCHRVFYCNKSPNRDRTVCLRNGYF